jgi:hypothetical protein
MKFNELIRYLRIKLDCPTFKDDDDMDWYIARYEEAIDDDDPTYGEKLLKQADELLPPFLAKEVRLRAHQYKYLQQSRKEMGRRNSIITMDTGDDE